jgi:L-asparaginase II
VIVAVFKRPVGRKSPSRERVSGMAKPVEMIEVWRGDILECLHLGHAVVCDTSGTIVEAWGNPDAVIYPRSSCKMIQALPLVESGAADAFGLRVDQLALSCASHRGAAIHTERVESWLSDLGLSEADLRCGPQEPADIEARNTIIRAYSEPCQIHNNCSGKHSGFLTYNKHIGAGPEYVDVSHPLQVAIRAAFEEVTGLDSPGYGIDGCSAPNFATTVHGLARAMGYFAGSSKGGSARDKAAVRLVNSMIQYPELVSGEGAATTELMRALEGKGAVKSGADGVYVGILPEKKLGIALKITDGSDRAKSSAMAALLIKLGVLEAAHPTALKYVNTVERNRRGLVTGTMKASPSFAV